MKGFVTLLGVAALATVVLPAKAEVNVKFVEPDRFADIGPYLDRRTTLAQIERLLKSIGEHHVAQGQVLEVEVLDVDLAGTMESLRGGSQEYRIQRGGADWPRIKLHYALKSDGKVVKQGAADVKDMNYQNQPLSTQRNEPLSYEKRMLEVWFRETFAQSSARQ